MWWGEECSIISLYSLSNIQLGHAGSWGVAWVEREILLVRVTNVVGCACLRTMGSIFLAENPEWGLLEHRVGNVELALLE